MSLRVPANLALSTSTLRWVWLVIMAGALMVVGVSQTAAQPPPLPPHQYFGADATAATIDGVLAPDGTVVTALNESDVIVGTDVVAAGVWLLQVDLAQETVHFELDGQPTGKFQPVIVGFLTNLKLTAVIVGPPTPPHQVFGAQANGSGAMIDGAPAPDGTVVTALNEFGAQVGETTIAGGLWLIQVPGESGSNAYFLLNGLHTQQSLPVAAGALTRSL